MSVSPAAASSTHAYGDVADVLMAKKSLDQVKLQGQQALQLIQSTPASIDHRGQLVSVRA